MEFLILQRSIDWVHLPYPFPTELMVRRLTFSRNEEE